MENKKIRIAVAVLALGLALGAGKVFAQSTAGTEGTVKCFDYYKFQSVQVSVDADKNKYIPQEDVIFRGTLENQNDYPVVDGLVFARIGKNNPNYDKEGQFVVDELILLKDISLASKEKKEVEFQWTIPEGFPAGDYQADFFFSVGKKFNLGGLPFTNEIVVGSAGFSVKSPVGSYVSFDKSQTKVNGEKYDHIGNWPVIEPGKSAEIVQSIKNTFSKAQAVEITYDLYFWDSLNEGDKISSKQENIVVPANKSANLNYTVAEMKDSVYYLKITAVSETQKSIVNIRLASNQVHPRLNYPAITKFPLQKGDQETIFSCFHNTALPDAKGKVNLTLTDKNNKKVGEMNYSGKITGAMMAAKNDFVSNADYGWLKLTATLTDEGGKTVDQYEAVYDCSKINSEKCKEILKKTGGFAGSENKTGAIAIIIVAVLFVISLGLIVWKKRRISGMSMWICFFLLGSLFMFSGMSGAEAKSTTVDDSYLVSWDEGRIYVDGDASIKHIVQITEGDLNLKIGDPINFSYKPEKPFFTAIGFNNDTPYGAWTGSLDKECTGGGSWLEVNLMNWGGEVYNNVNAIKPNVYMSSSDSSVISCSGMNCTALKKGTATLTANIANANGISCVRGFTNDEYYSQDLSFPSAIITWDVNVTPHFYTLTVAKSGTGAGTITSNTGDIECGAVCSDNFAETATVTLTAIPDSGSRFSSWSSNCTPLAANPKKCQVAMSQAQTVTAAFEANDVPIAIVESPNVDDLEFVSGNVYLRGKGTDSDGSILKHVWFLAGQCDIDPITGDVNNCSGTPKYSRDTNEVGSSIHEIYDSTLAARENPYVFYYRVRDNSNKWSAYFKRSIKVKDPDVYYTLTVNVNPSGLGYGSVSSNDGKISDCSATCTASYRKEATPTQVILTAKKNSGYKFASPLWTGNGAGNPRNVTMNSDKSVTANFEPNASPACTDIDCKYSEGEAEKHCRGSKYADKGCGYYVCDGSRDCTGWTETGPE